MKYKVLIYISILIVGSSPAFAQEEGTILQTGGNSSNELYTQLYETAQKATAFELLYAAKTSSRAPRPANKVKLDAHTRLFRVCNINCLTSLSSIIPVIKEAQKVSCDNAPSFTGLLSIQSNDQILLSIAINHNSRILFSMDSCWLLPESIDKMLRSRDIFFS